MSKEVFEKKDVKSSEISESNNADEKSKKLLKYNKYRGMFDITISNDTVIFKVKYPQ